jgi:hypothetical protein
MVKVQITILLSEELLREIDEFRKHLGLSRAALFVNAYRVYKLFFDNKLGSGVSHTDEFREQLSRIEIMLGSIESESKHIKDEIQVEIDKEPDIHNVPNFIELRDQIISLLETMKSLSTPTLSKLLGIEEGITFTICSQLKKDNILILNELYEWQIK